jgi:hypothetical protein
MVDVIVQLTVVAVVALGALNALHGGAVLVRLIRLIGRRPYRGLDMWLPAFTNVHDIHSWLRSWRDALGTADPAVAKLRRDAGTVIGRHLYLTVLSHTWALAVTAVSPRLA